MEGKFDNKLGHVGEVFACLSLFSFPYDRGSGIRNNHDNTLHLLTKGYCILRIHYELIFSYSGEKFWDFDLRMSGKDEDDVG